jgi:hypothetical protein
MGKPRGLVFPQVTFVRHCIALNPSRMNCEHSPFFNEKLLEIYLTAFQVTVVSHRFDEYKSHLNAFYIFKADSSICYTSVLTAMFVYHLD